MNKVLLIILLVFSFIISAEEKKSEAKVSFEKKEGKVHYSIDIEAPFKLNRKAPFRFTLYKGNNEKKIALKKFTQKNGEHYSYDSTYGEDAFKYWFIACKYNGDKVVACKTFTKKVTIK